MAQRKRLLRAHDRLRLRDPRSRHPYDITRAKEAKKTGGTVMRIEFETTIERGEEELDITVTYETSRRVAPILYGPGAGPGYGGEIDIIDVTGPNGRPLTLSDDEMARIIDIAADRVDDDIQDYDDGEADYRYEMSLEYN